MVYTSNDRQIDRSNFQSFCMYLVGEIHPRGEGIMKLEIILSFFPPASQTKQSTVIEMVPLPKKSEKECSELGFTSYLYVEQDR